MGHDFKGFSKLNRTERFSKLQEMGLLEKEDVKLLKDSQFLKKDLAEDFIENSLGYFPIPYGVVTHLKVNGKKVLVPMAVEETSIIAAASKTSKWINDNKGFIRTNRISREGIGQIQFSHIKDGESFCRLVEAGSPEWVKLCNNSVSKSLFERGGGVKKFTPRVINRPDEGLMGVIHVYVDTCEAMGANVINQVCEFMKPTLEDELSEVPTMCILSNLMDSNLTEVTVEFEVEKSLGEKIQEASYFAEVDPYRAATNNKGIMNAIDSVLIATGNDWRAVEAGVHSYAARGEKYSSLAKWRFEAHEDIPSKGLLKGVMQIPISIGTVGGVTKLHPFAQLSMKLAESNKVDDLAGVMAAVGLVQNLGALRALTTVGIIEGHMRLHIKNLALGAGAEESEAPILQKKLEEILRITKRISLSQAKEALTEIRAVLKGKKPQKQDA